MSEGKVTAALKQAVIDRARGCCEYCLSQSQVSVQPFSIEHTIPRSKGGKTSLENLALACQGCNGHKYNKTEGRDPLTGRIVPLYNPRQYLWKHHFTWSNDYTEMFGLTAIGRATISMLRLNRQGVVECHLLT